MSEYVYYTDDDYPGMQWRYAKRVPEEYWAHPLLTEGETFVWNTGDVRLDGGGWQFATTTLADHINDRVNREVTR